MRGKKPSALEAELERIAAGGQRPGLLLHSCCAPCSSSCLEYLAGYFDITVYYYNPNLYPREEYLKRAGEQERLIREMGLDIALRVGEFDDRRFYEETRGLEECAEGGARCEKCFRLRLAETARAAKEGAFSYFATTLTVSPHKNAALITRIGEELSGEYGVRYLPADFKKRDGYKRSIELSRQYDLYRQNYCGCVFSLRDSR